jgi:hypothetical protein
LKQLKKDMAEVMTHASMGDNMAIDHETINLPDGGEQVAAADQQDHHPKLMIPCLSDECSRHWCLPEPGDCVTPEDVLCFCKYKHHFKANDAMPKEQADAGTYLCHVKACYDSAGISPPHCTITS